MVSHPKTVKNLLDNPALKEEISSSKIKSEKVEGIKPKEEPKENKVPLNPDKSTTKQTDVKTENTVTSKSVLQYHHQSNGDTAVEKLDKVQSEKTPDTKHSSLPSPGFLPFSPTLPLMGGHPAAMFYPPAFMPMGAVSPLGLPIMHHLPLNLPAFIPPSPTDTNHLLHHPKSSKAATHETSSLSSSMSSISSSHSKSGNRNSNTQHAQVTMATNSKASDSKSHHSVPSSPFRSSSSSPNSMKCLMTPPAHMNGLKRPFNASPMSHIPSPYRPPFANKSLLFDFESPKRPKVENGSSNTKNSSSNTQDCEQPTDLSMKTLRKLESFVKKETQKLNGNNSDAVDLRCYSPRVQLDSPQDLSKKMSHSSHKHISSSSTKTNNISVPHIPGSRTESPHNVVKKSKPSVFSHPSQLFNKDSKIQPSGDSKIKSVSIIYIYCVYKKHSVSKRHCESIYFPCVSIDVAELSMDTITHKLTCQQNTVTYLYCGVLIFTYFMDFCFREKLYHGCCVTVHI